LPSEETVRIRVGDAFKVFEDSQTPGLHRRERRARAIELVAIRGAGERIVIVFEKHKQLDLLNTKTGEINLTHAPDEIRFEVEQFNKRVVTTEFNRVVAEELVQTTSILQLPVLERCSSSRRPMPMPISW